jgi:hypothetical protein
LLLLVLEVLGMDELLFAGVEHEVIRSGFGGGKKRPEEALVVEVGVSPMGNMVE